MQVQQAHSKSEWLIVVPDRLDLITKSLAQSIGSECIGIIDVSYPYSDEGDHEEKTEEYDEEEQLYSLHSSAIKQPKSFKILQGKERKFTMVAVPMFKHSLTYNLIATEIATKLHFDNVLVVVPTNTTKTVTKLVVQGSVDLDQVPSMEPPQFVTGPGAAMLSSSQFAKHAGTQVCLGLSSDGALNYERVGDDALLDAAAVISQLLGVKLGIEKALQEKNSSSSIGMYV